MDNVSLPPLYVQNSVPISTDVVSSHISSRPLLRQSDIPISISIVSNSRLLREALTLFIQRHWSIDICHCSQGEINRVSTVLNSNQQLVLLDSSIGHSAVLAQIQEWRSLQLVPYIIVLEVRDDPDTIVDYIEAGSHGYALQGASSAEVIQIIEQVYQGIAHCSPEITAKIFDRLTKSKTTQQSQSKPALTRREVEVLHLIAKECSDRDIAAELVIEVRTVKHHVHNILRKFDVKYRRDAAQLAINNGLLNLTSS